MIIHNTCKYAKTNFCNSKNTSPRICSRNCISRTKGNARTHIRRTCSGNAKVPDIEITRKVAPEPRDEWAISRGYEIALVKREYGLFYFIGTGVIDDGSTILNISPHIKKTGYQKVA